MTRLSSKLGLTLALVAFSGPAFADVQDDFQEGVQLLKQGRRAEALAAFQKVLAGDPSNEEAYELWKATDEELFLDMLVAGGEYERVASRFLDRARLGRVERRNDASAISDLVNALKVAEGASDRRATISKLSAEHGEYAVPRLVRALADASDSDWRITAMHALTEMDTDVVLPLVAALGTEDAYQRANIAMVLGYIGDPRAAAALTHQVEIDQDSKVRRAAQEAASRCGASGSAASMFLAMGEDYHFGRANVLRSFDYSDVVWSWDGGDLAGNPVPRSIYNSALAKAAYYNALSLEPGSIEALAGIARSSVDIASKLSSLAQNGEDVSDFTEQADEGILAASASGVEAVDLALHWSVISEDSNSGVGLARLLGQIASSSTGGLQAAMDCNDVAMRGEAAVALAHIAVRSGQAASDGVVRALGDATGREVVRVAALIDGNSARADQLAQAIVAQGAMVNSRNSGAQGISLVRRVPTLDVILVGDSLPDMTVDQVISASSAGGSDVPIILVSSNEEFSDAFSDRVSGTIADLSNLEALEEVFSAGFTGDRAQADALAQDAAAALAALARGGNSDLSAALDGLTSPLAQRPDLVTVPAMAALASAGTPDQIGALLAVLTDDARSDAARMAAGDALTGILGRYSVAGNVVSSLRDVIASSSSLGVRAAAARAMGLAQLSGEDRSTVVQDSRVDVRGE